MTPRKKLAYTNPSTDDLLLNIFKLIFIRNVILPSQFFRDKQTRTS